LHAWGDEEPYKILVGKPEGKKTVLIPRRVWENNIKTKAKDMGYLYLDSGGSV